MTERLLNLLEPRGVDRPALLAGWITGGVVGTVVAIAALLALTGAHIWT
jgi:hypothetical protein